MWQGLKEIIFTSTNLYVPKKRIKNNPDPEYYTKKIRLLKKRVRVAHKRKDRDLPSMDRYRELVKELTMEKVLAEEVYVKNTLDSGNPNELYKYLRRRKGDRNYVHAIKSTHGDNLMQNQDIAEEFNMWFAQVFNKDRPRVDDSLKGDNVAGQSCPNYLEITNSIILRKIQNLKNRKSKGPDDIPSDAIKLGNNAIVPYLRTLFIATLNNNSIPGDWTKAIVIPIHKGGLKSTLDNYRPISLTSQVCKVMEKIIADHIRKYWKENDWLSDRQHGFRSGFSCETQLLGLVQDISETMDFREEIDAVVIDLAKAFDKVPHDLLIAKIRNLNIDHRVTNWIKLFLKNRKQKVRIGDAFSEEIDITSGIPQGSVLGPLLFLIYVNDLPANIKSEIRLFADDCIVYRRISGTHDRELLQNDLNQIAEWTKVNGMEINVSKCKHIKFSRRKSLTQHSYFLNNENINSVTECKYLGVKLAEDLKWGRHVEDIVAKAYKNLHFVMRSLKGSRKGIRERAFQTLVRPIIEYASSVWDPHETGLVKKLEGVQRKAARYVVGKHKKAESVTRMLAHLKWESLESRRKILRLAGMFKAWNSAEGWGELNARLHLPTYIGRGDHSFKIKERVQKTDTVKYSFVNRGIREWNSLPEEVLLPMPKNVKTFKSRLKSICKL